MTFLAVIAVIAITVAFLWIGWKSGEKDRAIARNIRRHQAAYDLLRFHAYSDERLSRNEIDIIASYMQTIPGYVVDAAAFKKQLAVNVPALSTVPRLIMTVQEKLTPQEIGVLAYHVEMLKGTKKRHAPAIAQWYEETLRELRPRRSDSQPINDLRLV